MQLFEGIFPNSVYISLEEYIIKQYLTITMKNIYLSILYEKYLFPSLIKIYRYIKKSHEVSSY